MSKIHLGVISPINTSGGIAEYTKNLYDNTPSGLKVSFLANSDATEFGQPDSDEIYRLWVSESNNFQKLLDWIKEYKPNIIHIQHHPALISPDGLRILINEIKNLRIKIFLTLHSVFSTSMNSFELMEDLAKCSGILIHNENNYSALREAGLKNVILFQHGYEIYPKKDKQILRKKLGIDSQCIIVTHGLITPFKGLLNTAYAVKELTNTFPDVIWLAINALNMSSIDSTKTYRNLVSTINKLSIRGNVYLVTDYLSEKEVATFIQAGDIGIAAYDEVGEAASGAVRKFISNYIPTIVTDIPVMAEFGQEVYKIASSNPTLMYETIKSLFADQEKLDGLRTKSAQIVDTYNWKATARRLYKLYLNIG